MSWLRDYLYAQTQNAVLAVLGAGPVPRHIAFVMDGNRRYARRQHKHVAEGHKDGFAALRRMLEICMRLGVRCVTAYAFSIENFKRDAEEVSALMALAEEKLLELCRHGDLLEQYDVRINVVGKTELLPENVKAAVHRAESMTRHHKTAILNLCMPYTSRDEMTTAVERAVRKAVDEAGPDGAPSEITEKDVDEQLMTTLSGSPPLDILIRTSGVKRLSDFLLWQCCENTQIQFTNAYWPEFGLFDLIPIILDYQRKAWTQDS